MRSIILLAFIVAIGTIACAKMRPGFNTYDAVYNNAIIFDNDHTLTMTGVVEDSRCPIGIQCTWAGQAVIGFRAIANNADTVEFDLYLGDEITGPRDTVLYDEYLIQLWHVAPARELDQELTDEDYTCRVLVQKMHK